MSSKEPWRDKENYTNGKIVKCLECKQKCHRTHWGDWCYECNVKRIERINKSFSNLGVDI